MKMNESIINSPNHAVNPAEVSSVNRLKGSTQVWDCASEGEEKATFVALTRHSATELHGIRRKPPRFESWD